LEEAIGYLVPEDEELDGEIYALVEVGQSGREAEGESEEGGQGGRGHGHSQQGYASRAPEVVVDRRVAEELGIYPSLPPGSRVARYRTASGRVEEFIRVDDCAEVQVVEADRASDPVRVSVVISPHAAACLLSDKLLSALKIVILDPGEGLWCFRDELGRAVRSSA